MKKKYQKTFAYNNPKLIEHFFYFFIFIIFSSCTNTLSNSDEVGRQPDTVLRLSDIPRYDTTGRQSIYKHISPYEVKGIDPPESEEERLYERYNGPYSHFEFIENAHSDLSSMGYKTGSIVEFSFNLLHDTLWAKKAFYMLNKHSTKTYLGTESAFLDSIKNANRILVNLKNDPEYVLRKKTDREF